MSSKHPDFDRYCKACEYPATLDEAAVQQHLSDYCAALGVKCEVRRLPKGWTLESEPALAAYVRGVMKEFNQRRDARAAVVEHPTHGNVTVPAGFTVLVGYQPNWDAVAQRERRNAD